MLYTCKYDDDYDVDDDDDGEKENKNLVSSTCFAFN